jgi:hypothetical protein
LPDLAADLGAIQRPLRRAEVDPLGIEGIHRQGANVASRRSDREPFLGASYRGEKEKSEGCDIETAYGMA